MNTSRTLKATIAAATAGFIALGPAAGGATAVSAPASGAPTEPSTAPVDVGQSVQLRVDANGVPNSDLVDFRWSITQITIPGGDIPETVTYPDQGLAVRSLDGFAEPTSNDNGTVTAPVDNHGTWGSVRTVGLMPQDFEVPVELTTKFTLNGEEMLADDMIGADGMVTTEYCIKNLSTKTMEVPITTLGGQEITEKVEAQVPMVAQASTLIPQRYVDLNMGAGLGGADGRGNTQAQWIVLPFTPINQDGGKACFGWAANVEDMVLPPMLIQVAPVYIPEEDKEKEEDDGGSFGLPTLGKPSGGGPDLSAGKNEITAGVAQVLEAMQGIANNRASGGDPLQSIGDALTGFFDDLGIKIVDVSEGLNDTIRKTDKNATRLENLAPRFQTLSRLFTKLADDLSGFTPAQSLINFLASDALADLLTGLSDDAAALSTLSAELQKAADILTEGAEDLPKIDCTVPDPDERLDSKRIGVGAWNKEQIGNAGLKYQDYVSGGWGKLPAGGVGYKSPTEDEGSYVVNSSTDGYNPVRVGPDRTAPVFGSVRDAAQTLTGDENKALEASDLAEYGVVSVRSVTYEDPDSGLDVTVGAYVVEKPQNVFLPSGFISTNNTTADPDSEGDPPRTYCEEQAKNYYDTFSSGFVAKTIAEIINDAETFNKIVEATCDADPDSDDCRLLQAIQGVCDDVENRNECTSATEITTIGRLLQRASNLTERISDLLTRVEDALPGPFDEAQLEQLEELSGLLKTLRDNLGSFRILADLSNTVGGILDGLGGTLRKLNTAMIDLQVTLAGAGDKLSKSQVNLPTTAAVVSDLVEKALQTDNAQLLLGGLDQTKAGFGLVSAELSAFIGDVVAQISAALASIKAKIPGAKASAQNAIAELNAKVNTLKGNVGGMVMAAHQSPLPYGGNPADAPEGTQLAGAYEYRMDAADWNSASTPARYVIGLLALFAAGGIGVLLARRGAA
jgi:hypothetical protein